MKSSNPRCFLSTRLMTASCTACAVSMAIAFHSHSSVEPSMSVTSTVAALSGSLGDEGDEGGCYGVGNSQLCCRGAWGGGEVGGGMIWE